MVGPDKVGPEKRESLLRAADRLFHHKGLEHTSIADIASAAEVPLGNVYYYFKTRGALVKSVTERRLAYIRGLRAEWDALPSPRDRLLAYVKSYESRTEDSTAHGCPVGGLCVEANKLGGPIARDAGVSFRETLVWIAEQFRAMGFSEREAEENAAQLLGGRQGSILLSNTFRDPKYIREEIARRKKWLAGMPAGKERKSK